MGSSRRKYHSIGDFRQQFGSMFEDGLRHRIAFEYIIGFTFCPLGKLQASLVIHSQTPSVFSSVPPR